MKFNIVNSIPQPRLPKVGEYWIHKHEPRELFLRIGDEQGRRALQYGDKEHYFYSVSLIGGMIRHTNMGCDDSILILEQVNPAEFAIASGDASFRDTAPECPPEKF